MKICVLTLLIWSAPAMARWMTPAEAGSVVEHFFVDYTVDKNGSWTQTTDYVVRVQAEDAKVSASLFPIEYNAFTDKVEILEAYTLNGKEKIPVEAAAIEDRDKGEAKDYDAMKVRSVVFPQVQIGSKLFIRYRVQTAVPLLDKRWSEEVTLAPGLFVEKFKVTVNSSEMPLYFETQDPQKLVSIKQRNSRSIEMTNRHPLPGWVHAEKDPFFHPGNITSIWISTHKNWSEFLSPLEKDFASVLAAPVPKHLQTWVHAAEKIKDPQAQILYLMERMSREFRYFGDWRRHNGTMVPRSLAEIEKSRYGDCKDLASLLTSMLRALKMDANVALIRRGENPWGEEPDYKLPDVNRFNHAIVQVRSGQKVWWLDATNPVASLEPIPDITGRPAWVMPPGGGHFDRLPPALSQDYAHVYNYEYRFKGVDLVNVKVDATLKHMAPYHVANELLMAPRSEVLSDVLEHFSEGQDVRSFKFLHEPQTSRTLGDMHIDLEFDSGRVTFEAGKAAFFVIPDSVLGGAFYETESRESDIRLAEEPYRFEGARRLKDTRLAQVAPEPCRIESVWLDLERTISVDKKDVIIAQKMDLKRPYITSREFRSAAFRKLQQESKKCFYRSGILVEPLNGPL